MPTYKEIQVDTFKIEKGKYVKDEKGNYIPQDKRESGLKVNIDEQTAETMNRMLNTRKIYFEQCEDVKDEKELRKELFAKLKEAGVNMPKNTTTEVLTEKVNEL